MTRQEFLHVAAYITACTQRALPDASLEVYFDLLGDLEYETLLTAAKRVILEHPWATFPSIAELRQAASEVAAGGVGMLSAGEAWEIAWRVAANTDPEVDGSFARAVTGKPPLVVRAIKAFGLLTLCYGDEPVGVVRGQFMKIYEQLAAREKRAALLPPSLAPAASASRLPAAVRGVIEGIGKPPE